LGFGLSDIFPVSTVLLTGKSPYDGVGAGLKMNVSLCTDEQISMNKNSIIITSNS